MYDWKKLSCLFWHYWQINHLDGISRTIKLWELGSTARNLPFMGILFYNSVLVASINIAKRRMQLGVEEGIFYWVGCAIIPNRLGKRQVMTCFFWRSLDFLILKFFSDEFYLPRSRKEFEHLYVLGNSVSSDRCG